MDAPDALQTASVLLERRVEEKELVVVALPALPPSRRSSFLQLACEDKRRLLKSRLGAVDRLPSFSHLHFPSRSLPLAVINLLPLRVSCTLSSLSEALRVC
jgi:hypothetical protein